MEKSGVKPVDVNTESLRKDRKVIPASPRVRKCDQTIFSSSSSAQKKKNPYSVSEASGFDWQQLTVDSRGAFLCLRHEIFRITT